MLFVNDGAGSMLPLGEITAAHYDDTINLASQVPLGRVGEPIELANAAGFLASDDSSFVNGAGLFVDGWQTQI